MNKIMCEANERMLVSLPEEEVIVRLEQLGVAADKREQIIACYHNSLKKYESTKKEETNSLDCSCARDNNNQ